MSILEIKELNIINLGLESLKCAVEKQNIVVNHVNWKPEANGDLRLLEIISRLEEMDS